MSREILVMGDKTFKISVPDEAKLTFGPWSPANDKSTSSYSSARALNGTLRVYENSKASASVIAVFSGVTGYRDMSVEYMEQLIKEEGATIWKSDKNGYVREEKVNRTSQWDDPIATELLNAGEDTNE